MKKFDLLRGESKMRKIISALGVLGILLIMFLFGCTTRDYYPIKNVNPENQNIGFGEETKLFFDIENKAKTTLTAEVEVEIDETCFREIQEKELGEISPGKTLRSYVLVRSNENYNGRLDSCNGEVFEIKILVKDISGRLLNSETKTIGIVD